MIYALFYFHNYKNLTTTNGTITFKKKQVMFLINNKAQQDSTSTSTSSLFNNNKARIGSAGSTLLISTGGFSPRHKLYKHRTNLFFNAKLVSLDKILNK